MIMRVASLLKKNANPQESEIRAALAGNLCCSGTHLRIVKAVKRVS
jgi:nicotinate dehydrogenase subunit A